MTTVVKVRCKYVASRFFSFLGGERANVGGANTFRILRWKSRDEMLATLCIENTYVKNS